MTRQEQIGALIIDLADCYWSYMEESENAASVGGWIPTGDDDDITIQLGLLRRAAEAMLDVYRNGYPEGEYAATVANRLEDAIAASRKIDLDLPR